MRSAGRVILLLGVALIIAGAMADSTLGGNIVNLGQLFTKGALIIVGAACLPTGAILLVFGARKTAPDGSKKDDRRPEAITLWQVPGQKRPPY